jgi:hypothetical protein
MEETLSKAASDPRRRIVRLDENLPLIPNITPTAVWRDNPMRVSTMRTILDTVARIVRPDRQLRLHDIRHRAAEDLLHIAKNDRMTLRDIGEELDHSATSITTTRRHTKKALIQDTWQARGNLPDKRNTFSEMLYHEYERPLSITGPREKRGFLETL